jgi:hypothetical protein
LVGDREKILEGWCFMNFNEFLAMKKSSSHRINFEVAYIDMAGDFVAGALLSQILYWFEPDKDGRYKTRVTYKGRRAIAKSRNDWYDEIRISPKQYDKAINILIKKGIVTVINSMFNAKRTPFIMLNEANFIELYRHTIELPTVFTKGEYRSIRKVNTEIDQKVIPLTETTTEIKTENTYINTSASRRHEDFFYTVIDYYYEVYRSHKDSDHPRLKKEHTSRAIQQIETYTEDKHLDLDAWQYIIGSFFNSNIQTDYNILHFLTDGMLEILCERQRVSVGY